MDFVPPRCFWFVANVLFCVVKDSRSMFYARLSLVTLCCMFEDDQVNQLAHDEKYKCVIPFYQVQAQEYKSKF